MYGRKMRSMLAEITKRLNGLYENKNMLGVDINTILALRSNRKFERLEETSLLDESPVLGREKDEAAVLEKLLGDESCNQNVSVVCIVGFGGVGKTSLARLLYNNEKVKDYFELTAWVCVSNYFDVLAVSKPIYQAVSGEDNTPPSINSLQEKLKEKLSKKRFLLVLDDVWNEDHQKWKNLEKPLKGAPGSKIIVTTRKAKVASAMDNVKCHNIEILSDEDSLSLLAKSAINEHNFDNHPLLSLAQDIIMKCKGLPLALIAIGRVLKGKGNDEWDKLLKSEIWSSDDGEGDILPVLKLSYYDLPLHLKKLFAYCSLFPKDYLFNKNKLVLLWMAEGFISESKRTKTMESLGRQYFEDLLSRSFFQHSTKNESEYIMHDLMNDLAISVAGEFFFVLDDKMNVNGRNEGCSELFSLPVSFAKLINLRHLDMSDTPMLDKTPLGIGGLTSLQTLTKVFIEGANAFKVSDLKGLVNLEGHISIVGLEKVTDPQQAMEANLEGKKGIVSLEMKWGEQFDDSRNLQRECEVIESMRPHSKLNKLKILNYGGMKFPSWFANPSFDKLTKLTIEWCVNCTHFNGNAFPLLKYLKFFKSGLESFNCPNSVERLEIWKCNSMTSLNLSHPVEIKGSELLSIHHFLKRVD
ncbi:putative disease resistance RPP13-like protein 1 [Rutidosis leptorrhynchoides]|uniref:putative disease resistance RPP13-like protein 1 n=1 Tax=Rutidosis leptorrhynchoides TaxID=125765 RepID=UPI003A99831B